MLPPCTEYSDATAKEASIQINTTHTHTNAHTHTHTKPDTPWSTHKPIDYESPKQQHTPLVPRYALAKHSVERQKTRLQACIHTIQIREAQLLPDVVMQKQITEGNVMQRQNCIH